ncbi:MAG TPA: IS4 family transposase [Ktedonobacteraceae bacterium]
MSKNELEEPETWAVETFGLAELGDLRRTDRLVQLAAALARDPQSSLPASLRGEAETVGAYRFLNNAALFPEQILMPHFVQTRREAAKRAQVLMIGDTTECNLSSHHSVQGAGPVGRSSLAQGFFVHSVLARDAQTEELLGCAYQQPFVRQPAPEKETPGQHNQRERESRVWEQSVRGIGPVPTGSQWIYVGDRGSDIFPFWQACQQLGYDFTIRVAQDRGIAGKESEPSDDPALLYLKSRARQLLAQDVRLLALPATAGSPARDAVVEVSFEAVRIQPPIHNTTLEKTELSLWVVRVWEPLPPAGVEPLEWILLTSVPVLTVTDAWEQARWYRCRWLIEEFHKVLKSGCRLEDRRMHTVSALENLLAILTPIGMRLLRLRDLARLAPDLPATQIVSQEIVNVVAELSQRPQGVWTVRDLCCAMARFGGFLARKCDGLPGWQTLWKGWVFVQTVLLGVHLAALLPPS